MPTESDMHLLEAYLDDGLNTSQVLKLDARLSAEPALASALGSLRGQRAARRAVYAALTPPQEDADQFVEKLLGTLHRRGRHSVAKRYVRAAAAIAAVLLVGFAVGWIGHGNFTVSNRAKSPEQSGVVTSRLHGDTHLAVHAAHSSDPGQYRVAVLDDNGNVVAIQPFNKLEDARQFADDVGQYELRQRQVQENQAMLVSDRF